MLFSLLRPLAAIALAVILAVPAAAGPQLVSDVERVSFHERSDGGGYVVRVHTSDRVRAYSLEEGEGTVDLVVFRAELAPDFQRDRARGPVRDYDVDAQNGRVTVRLQLETSVEVQAYPDRDSDDLLLALSNSPRPSPLVARDPVPRPIPPTTTPPPVVPPAVTAPVPREAGENWRLDTIVLDAGHGGHDTGGSGPFGLTDAMIALDVVKELGPRVERELGVRVVYTRTEEDTFVELRERGRIANQEGAKLFVSVHGNSVASPQAHGTETIFLAPRGARRAREVAERENSVIELESNPELYVDFDDEMDILTQLAMSAYQEESQFLAGLVEREFSAQGRRSRGVKQDNLLVLWAASMPAVLVEVGFVSNPEEAAYLKSERGVREVTDAIFNAIKTYKEHYESGFRLASGS
ncbi:MAG: N-acetylmuramoyl-L-alanine amidase [Rubricoccaceae bacterium]